MKFCIRCQQDRPREDFTDDVRYRDGKNCYCRPCYRVYGRMRRYGITDTYFQEMYDAQAGGCAACEAALELWGKNTHIDHDHETGAIRGLLCRACNMALGCLKDSPRRCRALADYIEQHVAVPA